MATTIAELSVSVNATTQAAEDSLAQIDETAAKTGETMQASADEGTAAMDSMGVAGEEAGAKVAAGADEGAAALREQADAGEESEGFMKGFLGDMLGIGAGVGAVMIAGQAFDVLKDQLTETVQAGMEANQTQAQTAAVLKSTHGAAGETAQSVEDLADKYMNLTGISADTIQQSENMLLTFRGIGKDVFPQASMAALNMATALHIGPTQAALQLGKALDDPATGLSRLTREGVVFTAQQQEQIKAMVAAGNTAGAQKLMLAELNKEFGGSAVAAGQANGGIAILQAQMEETREKIGQDLIPILASLTKAFEPIVTAAGSLIPKAVDFLSQHADQAKIVLGVFAAVIATAVVPALIALLAPLAAAVGSIIVAAAPFVAVGVALAALALWFKHLYDTSAPVRDAINQIRAQFSEMGAIIGYYVQPILAKLGPILQQIGSFLSGQLNAAMNSLVPQIINAANTVSQFAAGLDTRLGPAIHNIFDFIQAALPVLQAIWNAVWPVLGTVISDVWGIIQGIITVAWSIISGIINVGLDIIGGNWSQAWNDIKTMLSGVWSGIEQILGNALNAVWTLLQNTVGRLLGLIGNLATGFMQELQALPGQALALFVKVALNITGEMQKLPGQLVTLGEQLLLGLIQGIENEVGHVISSVQSVAGNILGSMKSALGIASPSKEGATIGQQLMQGLANGILAGTGVVGSAAKSAAGSALSGLGAGVSGAALYGAGGAALGGSAAAGGSSAGQMVQVTTQINMDGQRVAQVVSQHQPTVLRNATGVRGM